MSTQYCTFSVAGLYLGVEVSRVQEVVRHQSMTRVPLAPPEIRGLINLRGQIVTAIDLRRRLRLPEADAAARTMNVLLQTADGVVSLVVDDIHDVVEVDEGTLEQPPTTLGAAARELVTAASKQHQKLLLILHVENAVTLDHANRGLELN
jgi:purine-binding chemotaxis protein CheW